MISAELRPRLSRRLLAPLLHLVASALVAGILAIGFAGLWFPQPYALVSGGWGLFILVVAVDLTLGPLLTWVIANPGKSRSEFRRDLLILVACQLAALGYGLYALSQSRPLYAVYEIDRFRVVSKADLDGVDAKRAPASLPGASILRRPVVIGVRPVGPSEVLESLELSLKGIELSFRPERWIPYADVRPAVIERSQPVDRLLQAHPEQRQVVEEAAAAGGLAMASIGFVPFVGDRGACAVLVSRIDARILGHIEVDPFL